MFDWLLRGLGIVLAWIEGWSGSYVVALIFYALIFKLLFSFFSIKQHKNQIKMAKLAPKIAVIREKYKGRNDQATLRKQQEEIMELQRKEGYSPLSGCLPLLIQLPIIIVLYNVIREPLYWLMGMSGETVQGLFDFVEAMKDTAGNQLYAPQDQIALIGVLKSLMSGELGGAYAVEIEAICGTSVFPNFHLWGMDLAQTPNITNFNLLVIIPVLAAAFQWFTMFITRKLQGNTQMAAAGGDSEQSQLSLKIMDLMMPLMTLFIAFGFSAMLGLYWIIQSIFGIAQTVILHLVMPIPKYTDEEIKAIRKAQRQAEKTQKNIIKTQPKYKSLHYIDDDDYEELPTINNDSPDSKSTGKTLAGQDKPEIKD